MIFIYLSPFSLQWNSYTFKIEKFSLEQQNNNSISTSPILFNYDQYWKIIVYPVRFLFLFSFLTYIINKFRMAKMLM